MNQQELIDTIGNRLENVNKQDIKLVTHELFEVVKEALIKKDRITISGFGTWTTKQSNRTSARNPKTGEVIAVKPKINAKWIPSQKFKVILNEEK